MKVAIVTLGCRVNIYDTEIMISMLRKNEFEIVSHNEFADVYCINTCTVTNNSDKKSRQFISKFKGINPDSIIAMVGCYPQVSKSEVSSIRNVDIILGNRFKSKLPHYINLFLETNDKVIKIDDDLLGNFNFEDGILDNFEDKHRAFIKIQDGCNKFCSYCIIPFARGGVCSKDPKKVYDEVKAVVDNGYKEIVLTGINTTSYGIDLNDNISLVDLIESIDHIKGLERIRIGSVDPEYFDFKIIERLSRVEKLMPHFHLSLQSGSDSVLKRMKRKYDTVKYEEVVSQFRELINDVSITTDLIVGFPGETEEEFQETVDFLNKIRLQDAHIFKYSKRSGTRAAVMDLQISSSVKSERSKIVSSIVKRNRVDFLEKYVGRVMDVLYCTVSSNNDTICGYTNNYIKVYSDPYDRNCLGKIVKTFIVCHNGEFLLGQIVK